MPPFPKLPLCALVVAALASAAEHHPSIAPGAREHPPIEEPAVLLPKFDDMTQAPTAASRMPPHSLSPVVSQWWETPTAVLMRRPQMAAILDAAEVGPAGDDHAKHAHDHDHQEGSRISGSGAITLPAVQVRATVHVREKKHAHDQPHPEAGHSATLKGESVDVAQGSMTSAPL